MNGNLKESDQSNLLNKLPLSLLDDNNENLKNANLVSLNSSFWHFKHQKLCYEIGNWKRQIMAFNFYEMDPWLTPNCQHNQTWGIKLQLNQLI